MDPDSFVWPLRLLGLRAPQQGDPHLPLLALPPGALVNHLVPLLSNKERCALSLTCRTLCELLASCVISLRFTERGAMCVAARSRRVLHFTNVRYLTLTLRGWHDAGVAAPRLLLHLAGSLPHLTAVVLLDRSHEGLPEPLFEAPPATAAGAAAAAAHALVAPVAAVSHLTNVLLAPVAGGGGGSDADGDADGDVGCPGCSSDSELPDLCGMLLALLALHPGLRKLEVHTKLLSEAELAALCRLPQLTSLTLNSEDGVEPGALRSLSALTGLRELRLGDVDGNSDDDVTAVCQLASQLTSLHMGYAPRLQPPVLRRLRQLHAGVQQYRLHQQQQQQGGDGVHSWQLPQLPGPGALAGLGAQAASVAASAVLRALGSVQQADDEDTDMPQYMATLSAAGVAADAMPGGRPDAARHNAAVARCGSSDAVATSPSASSSAAAAGSSGCGAAGVQVVTELSVNIDAEEGSDILKEMSRLALLESLLVDSTDEFLVDAGFQPFHHTTNLRRLAITMPMSLANTQSLHECKRLRDLLLCTLPTQLMGRGSLDQVTRLELLDVSSSRPNPDLLQAFPAVRHLVIHNGADDASMHAIGRQLCSLTELRLHSLPAGCVTAGLHSIAGLRQLRVLLLELAAPGGASAGRKRARSHSSAWPSLGGVEPCGGVLGAPAAGLGPRGRSSVLLAFAPPSSLLRGPLVRLLPGAGGGGHLPCWFPALRDLALLADASATDAADLQALSHLEALQVLRLHLPHAASRVTLLGLWQLVEASASLAEVHLSGAMQTQLLVPGRVPGVGVW